MLLMLLTIGTRFLWNCLPIWTPTSVWFYVEISTVCVGLVIGRHLSIGLTGVLMLWILLSGFLLLDVGDLDLLPALLLTFSVEVTPVLIVYTFRALCYRPLMSIV